MLFLFWKRQRYAEVTSKNLHKNEHGIGNLKCYVKDETFDSVWGIGRKQMYALASCFKKADGLNVDHPSFEILKFCRKGGFLIHEMLHVFQKIVVRHFQTTELKNVGFLLRCIATEFQQTQIDFLRVQIFCCVV